MTLQNYRELITFATSAAVDATTEADKARYAGQIEVLSFLLESETQARIDALHTGAASQHRPGTAGYIRAYNCMAAAQGLPLLAVVA